VCKANILRLNSKTKIQCCQFHVLMNGRQKLTKHPKTKEGQQLRKISLRITNIHTPCGVTRWGNDLHQFFINNNSFLFEKSTCKEDEWFTHKRVRSYAMQLLRVYESGNLFRHVYETKFKLANTNNFMEVGINSPIRRLQRKHNGVRDQNQ
jgi:hypothetical protein